MHDSACRKDGEKYSCACNQGLLRELPLHDGGSWIVFHIVVDLGDNNIRDIVRYFTKVKRKKEANLYSFATYLRLTDQC